MRLANGGADERAALGAISQYAQDISPEFDEWWNEAVNGLGGRKADRFIRDVMAAAKKG